MRTLKDREELTYHLWRDMFGATSNGLRIEMQKAIRYNYRKIQECRSQTNVYEDEVLDQMLVEPKAESIIREELFMTSKQERKHCSVIGPVIFILAVALLAVVAFGCRTVKGAADGFMLDGQAVFNYAVDHKDSSTQSQ